MAGALLRGIGSRPSLRIAGYSCPSTTTIKQVLINPVYVGANVYGRHKSGDTRVKPRDEWVVVLGRRACLVAPEIFEQV